MTVTEQDRLDLYEELKEVLRPAGLKTFMELLPRSSVSDLATRDDLAAQSIALRGEMAKIRAELKGEMAELRGEMAELRAELKGDMAELRAEMDLRFAQQTRTLLLAVGAFAVSTWFTVFAAAATV